MSSRRARVKAVAVLPARRRKDDQDRSKPATLLDTELTRGSPAAPPATPPAPPPAAPSTSPRLLANERLAPAIPSPKIVPSARSNLVKKSPQIAKEFRRTPLKSPRVTKANVPSVEKNVKITNSDDPVELSKKSSDGNVQSMEMTTVEPPTVLQQPPKAGDIISVTISPGSRNEALTKSYVKTPNKTTADANAPGKSPSPVLQGIVPLQATPAKQINAEQLNNEMVIAPEAVDNLFDPIVPLPSPSKIRPKLRPMPRLAPVRRNSVQGSASESEDEHKKSQHAASAAVAGGTGTPANTGRTRHDSQSSLSTIQSQPAHPRDGARIRNDSVCSAISHGTPAPGASPTKEKHFMTRSKRNEGSRQLNLLRRKLKTSVSNVSREKLTMYDLIFYNPTTNPIVETEEEKLVKEKNEKNAKMENLKTEKSKESADEDDPPVAGREADEGEGADVAAPVPQIKLGPNGEIILDEKSLVIETTEATNRHLSKSIVHETDWSLGGTGRGGRYTRQPRTREWSDAETVRFYRALAAVGTDFSLMQSMFPGRTRRDLKIKFKKEERSNSAQIDKALVSSSELNVESLELEFERERREAEEREKMLEERRVREAQEERDRIRKARREGPKLSRASKQYSSVIRADNINRSLTADFLAEEAMKERTRKRKNDQPKQHPSQHIAQAPKVPISPNPYGSYRKPNKPRQSTPRLNSPNLYDNSLASQAKVNNAVQALDLSNNPKVSNAQAGSLVCLTIPDPNNPKKNILQTYVTGHNGKLTPISLPPALLGNVMDYMKMSSPRQSSTSPFTSPASVSSQDSRKSVRLPSRGSPLSRTPGPSRPMSRDALSRQDRSHIAPLQPLNQTPSSPSNKRVRHNSYTITNL